LQGNIVEREASLCALDLFLPFHHRSEMAEKPAVLIIGGLGYIGRFLALHIEKNHLASEVRIVDKVLPQLAWLAPEFEEACSKDKFMQADASKERRLLIPVHCPAKDLV
jgi:nucleoside-diphosphate-sugar epimerase